MIAGVYHSVVVDRAGELGLGRLWFYYQMAYEVSTVALRGKSTVKMVRLEVTTVGWDDEDVTEETIADFDNDVMAKLVLRLVREQWNDIESGILDAIAEEGRG
jgi:hypothetical protein